MHTESPFLALFVVFLAGMVGGEVAQRLRLPSVVGQIAAGMALGPSALGWVHVDGALETLSEMGAVLLLFSVGLETRLHELRQVGKVAFSVGTFGVIVPFVLGGAWALHEGFSPQKAPFVAAAFVATSAGITAKVLQELGQLNRLESRVILGAAVIDDVLAMLVLVVVTAIGSGAGIDLGRLLVTMGGALLFVAGVAVLGSRVMRRVGPHLDAPMDAESPLTIALAICLGLSLAAASIGLAAIIGAFLAGSVLAETPHRKELESNLRSIMALLVPFFFVTTGTKVDVRLLAEPSVAVSVLVVTLLAVGSKLIGGALGARSLGSRAAWTVGIGMVPRGEVGIIVAALGERQGVFQERTYAIVVAMSLLTSVVAPPLLARRMKPVA